MIHTFPSLLSPNTTGYTFHESYRDMFDYTYKSRRRYVADWAGVYDTYGDGNVQHSSELLATDLHFADYCISLAKYAGENAACGKVLAGKAMEPLYRARVVFLSEVRYDENKPQWYCNGDMKVSKASSKANDRRWEKVPEWADGSPSAIFGLYGHHGDGLLNAYASYAQICKILDEISGRWFGNVAGLLDLGPSDKHGSIDNAFRALQSVHRSYWEMEESNRRINTFLENHKYRESLKTETATA